MSSQPRKCTTMPQHSSCGTQQPHHDAPRQNAKLPQQTDSVSGDTLQATWQASVAARFQQKLSGQSDRNAADKRRVWADIEDDTNSECELEVKGGDVTPAAPSSDTLTHSLLLQSFSGLSVTCSSSPDLNKGSGSIATEVVSRCVPELSNDTRALSADLPRIAVPVRRSETERQRGYAGLLSQVQGRPSRTELVTTPSLRPVKGTDEDAKVQTIVQQAATGLRASVAPEAALEGMGGTYFLSDEAGDKVAIFKPCDEEPLAPNNPKQWQGRAMGAPGVKPSVRVGEAALREVAAYLLDHDGFAGVPPACLAECYHPVLNYTVQMPRIETFVKLPVSDGEPTPCAAPTEAAPGWIGGLSRALHRPLQQEGQPSQAPAAHKLGSLQAYVSHKCDANDMSPTHFSADNVHRIGIFDIRLLNCDRHTGNLLVCERAAGGERASGAAGAFGRGAPYSLVPIDHGYALPEALDNPYFEWLFWPQTNIPFSDEIKDYVAKLDAAADAAMLREQVPALREECIRCLELSTKVLQMCVAAGLTLFEIGSIFSREGTGVQMSDLESLCIDARENALALSGESNNSSGGTTPSAPGSPVSGPLSSAHAGGLSNSMLPAVEEVDSDDAASECMFKLSGPGESSPTAMVGDMSPFTPALNHQPASGTDDDWVELSPCPDLFDPARYRRTSPVPFARSLLPGIGAPPAAPQSASGVAVSHAPAVYGQRGLMRARRNAWRTKHGGGPLPAYPPLVAGTHPDQVHYVFSDLSETQWSDFMHFIEVWVAAEIVQGTWRAASVAGPIAGSCPVAFK